MSYPLPTDTAHVKIESRQYRLLNFDLGEGIRRSSLKVAAMIIIPWFLLMLLLSVSILALPWLWLIPPSFATWAAVNRDASGRLRIRAWRDAALFRFTKNRRHIINGETARAESSIPSHDIEFLVIDS